VLFAIIRLPNWGDRMHLWYVGKFLPGYKSQRHTWQPSSKSLQWELKPHQEKLLFTNKIYHRWHTCALIIIILPSSHVLSSYRVFSFSSEPGKCYQVSVRSSGVLKSRFGIMPDFCQILYEQHLHCRTTALCIFNTSSPTQYSAR
jgi:hypothetical protein